MKFLDCIDRVSTFVDQKRVANAYVVDYRRLDYEELKEALRKTATQYWNFDNVKKTWDEIILSQSHNVRVLAPIIILDILLNKHDFSLQAGVLENEVIEREQDIINRSNEMDLDNLKEKEKLFKYVLECAWEHGDNISVDEKNLIEKIRVKFDITREEHYLISASIGRFPNKGNKIHSKDEIREVRRVLQSSGILYPIRDTKGVDYDVIPEEIALCIRQIYEIQMRNEAYDMLLQQKRVKKKEYLIDLLDRSGIEHSKYPTLSDLFYLCKRYIKPSEILGGFSIAGGLDVKDLKDWCWEIGKPYNCVKKQLITNIIDYYDNYLVVEAESSDERELYFQYFEEIANRNYDILRRQNVIKKDLDCEHLFEEATNYIFEKMLGHKPLIMKGNDHPDGMLSFNDKIIMWDNKSKEKEVNLVNHINQFDRYIRNCEKSVPVFIVIGPAFSEQSIDECVKYAANNDTLILLITAKELKDVAIKWKELHELDGQCFPLGYFKQNGRFSSKGIL